MGGHIAMKSIQQLCGVKLFVCLFGEPKVTPTAILSKTS
jgi:hypothetical protein